MTETISPRSRGDPKLWDPPPDIKGNTWTKEEYDAHLDTSSGFHELYPISESEEEEGESECCSVATSLDDEISMREEMTYTERIERDGVYTSDEDDRDSVISIFLRCRGTIDPNRPPQLVTPRHIFWPNEEEKKKLDRYAQHFGVLVGEDGGVYTTDEEPEAVEEPKPPRAKPRAKKPSPRKDWKRLKFYRQVQASFVKRFSQLARKEEQERRHLYAAFNIHRLIPAEDFCLQGCIELMDCMLAAVEERSGIVYFCAEFCSLQCESLSAPARGTLIRAILRAFKINFFSRLYQEDEESRRLNFVYITLLGHLFNFGVCPPKIIRYYVQRLFQTNHFGADEQRTAYFDPDSTIYATRLISTITYEWSSMRVPGSLKRLRQWLAHLRRAEKSPSYVVADINLLLANFTDRGKYKLANYARLNSCESQIDSDDLVLITANSFGRKLFCCREILSFYSFTFYQFFYSKYMIGKKEIHLDVDFCAMREILRVLYHCDRRFTTAHFQPYGEDFLLLMARTALQLDIPLIYRLCEEQLLQYSSLHLALSALDQGLPGITSRCLPSLDRSGVHDLLQYIIYPEKPPAPRDVDHSIEHGLIYSALAYIRYRHPRSQRKGYTDPQGELIFPLDFTTPWVMSDVVIETTGSGGRFLFVNRTVMSLFSSFFRDYPYSKARKWRGHWRIPTAERYATVRAALRILHHVKQKFITDRLPTLLPSMLVRLFRCASALDLPLIIRLCEEQLHEASLEYIISVIRLIDYSLLIPSGPARRADCLILAKKVLRS